MEQLDLIKSVANPELIGAIKRMREEPGREANNEFWEVLKNSRFLAPVNIKSADGTTEHAGDGTKIKSGSAISYKLVSNQEGALFFPAFTDLENLLKWSKKEIQQIKITSFSDYVAMILAKNSNAAGLVINPFGENMVIPKERLGYLTAKTMSSRVEKGTKVALSVPDPYPSEMVNAVKRYLKGNPRVEKAYLSLMVKNGEESFLFVVDYLGDDRRPVFDGIAKAALPYADGKALDMVSYLDNFGQQASAKKDPFYVRMTGGLN